MQKTTILIALLGLFSCTNNQTSPEDNQSKMTAPSVYSVKPLQIDNGDEEGWGADIRLSIVSREENDTAKTYKVVSTYEGKEVGLSIIIPKAKEGAKGFGHGLSLKSIGTPSDNLLSTLSKLYKQRADTVLQFTPVISVNYVNLKEFAKSLTGQEGEPYTVANEYKLFFEDETGNDYAELYLNVNPQENWVELREKDEEYRPIVIKFLRR